MLPNIFVGDRAPIKEVSSANIFETYWQSLIILSFLKGNRVKFFSWLGWAGIKIAITLSTSSRTVRSQTWLSYWIEVSFLLSYMSSLTFILCIWIWLFSPLATTTWLLNRMFFKEFIIREGVSSRYPL